MSVKRQDLIPCTCRLEAEVVEVLDARAKLFRRSRAQEINFLLQLALTNLQQDSSGQLRDPVSSAQ